MEGEVKVSAPDSVKPHDHPDVIGGIVWSPLELEWIDRIVAEKDARIAELERGEILTDKELMAAVIVAVMSAKQSERDEAVRKLQKHILAVEAERDALKAQLADAVETLKATKLLERQWGVTLAADCLKRLGVTGDK